MCYPNRLNQIIISVLLEEIDDLRQAGRRSYKKTAGGIESDSEMSISESVVVSANTCP